MTGFISSPEARCHLALAQTRTLQRKKKTSENNLRTLSTPERPRPTITSSYTLFVAPLQRWRLQELLAALHRDQHARVATPHWVPKPRAAVESRSAKVAEPKLTGMEISTWEAALEPAALAVQTTSTEDRRTIPTVRDLNDRRDPTVRPLNPARKYTRRLLDTWIMAMEMTWYREGKDRDLVSSGSVSRV